MTRKEAQDFFREHSYWLDSICGTEGVTNSAYKARFLEAVEAIMNDDPLVPLPCLRCGGTEITVIKGHKFPLAAARCNKCGATCDEINILPLDLGDEADVLEQTKQKVIAEWNKRA